MPTFFTSPDRGPFWGMRSIGRTMEKSKVIDSGSETGMTKMTPKSLVSTGEIVLYQPEGEVKLEVRVENETVWLTQAQMAELFHATKQNISLHIANIYKEGELDRNSVVKEYLTTASDGKCYRTKWFNLDVIISVGYRIKSIQGTRFRQWALNILKDYMLKGYAVNQRKIVTDLQIADRLHEQRQLIETQETRINNVDNRLSAVENHIDFFVKAAQTPAGGVIAPNTRFDGFMLIGDLVKSAKRSVVFIDPFATVDVLKFAAMRAKGVVATIFSPRITPEFKAAVDLHNRQYPGLELKTMRMIHDRFLLVDDTVYHFGASFLKCEDREQRQCLH